MPNPASIIASAQSLFSENRKDYAAKRISDLDWCATCGTNFCDGDATDCRMCLEDAARCAAADDEGSES